MEKAIKATKTVRTTGDKTEIITECMNCGKDIEPEWFDGQGEVWCDECLALPLEAPEDD